MNEHDTMVIRRLTCSYRRQIDWYDTLCGVVEKILGRLILSRGDFSGVKVCFDEKKRLLDLIEQERSETIREVETWRIRKGALLGEPEACDFDQVLRHTEEAIGRFLETEGQLKRCIEQRMLESSPGPVGRYPEKIL
jgi:hypothetical protein